MLGRLLGQRRLGGRERLLGAGLAPPAPGDLDQNTNIQQHQGGQEQDAGLGQQPREIIGVDRLTPSANGRLPQSWVGCNHVRQHRNHAQDHQRPNQGGERHVDHHHPAHG